MGCLWWIGQIWDLFLRWRETLLLPPSLCLFPRWQESLLLPLSLCCRCCLHVLFSAVPCTATDGITYLFVSNSDNLGATLDLDLLAYFARTDKGFLMEVGGLGGLEWVGVMGGRGGGLANVRGGEQAIGSSLSTRTSSWSQVRWWLGLACCAAAQVTMVREM